MDLPLRVSGVRLGDLFSEPPSGHMSIAKTWSNIGGVILSAGFLRVAWAKSLGYDDYLGYAFALAAITTPALASKLMGLRYGQTAPNGEAKK